MTPADIGSRVIYHGPTNARGVLVGFDGRWARVLFDADEWAAPLSVGTSNLELVGESKGPMSKTQRDFYLVQHAPAIVDTVVGLAYATHAVLKGPKPTRAAQAVAIEAVKEMATRFTDYVVTLQPFALDYHEAMTETELRAWAADVAAALRGE